MFPSCFNTPGLFMLSLELYATTYSHICFQVLQRIIRNLVAIHREQGQMHNGHSVPHLEALRNVVELQCILAPEYLEGCLLLARINLHLGINHAQVSTSHYSK
jgi:hypothetical protein